MKHSKLINILKTFSKEEMKHFEKFVSSPFHNSIKNNVQLLTELKRFYPGFNNEKLSYESLFEKIYPRKKYNRQMMWNLTSGFEKLAEEFLVQTSLKKNKFEHLEFLFWEFRDRKLSNYYHRIINGIEKLLETEGIDYLYWEKKGHLEVYKQFYHHLMDRVQFMSDSKLKASEYQILQFLRMAVGTMNDMGVLARSYNLKFDVNILLEFIKHTDLKKIVLYAHIKNYEYAFLMDIYYHSLMLFLEPKETQHLYKARELYEKHFARFSMSEKRTIMHWILNYCNWRADESGHSEYRKIIFELNEFRLNEGLAFFPEGRIPKANYNQILNGALSVNKIKWAEDFIKKYSPMLQPEIRQGAESMALATLYIKKKQYSKALKTLSTIEFVDIIDKLTARGIQAISYYEMKEFETLLNHIDSSKHFLNKNKFIGEFYHTAHGNFYNYLQKLLAVREENEDTRLLCKKIKNETILSNKSWLIEKTAELEKI
ncbi:MAG: hypothetical protein L0Y79_02560 [Chlorobi bacterium]|nr:hypothetical protein [Chlorobiota bacterium]